MTCSSAAPPPLNLATLLCIHLEAQLSHKSKPRFTVLLQAMPLTQKERPLQLVRTRNLLTCSLALFSPATLALAALTPQNPHKQPAGIHSRPTNGIPKPPQAFAKTMAPWGKKTAGAAAAESSALRELKETVKSQSAEIERLKLELSKKGEATDKKSGGGAAVSHGAHGGGGTEIEEEIHSYLDRPFFSLARHRVGWLTVFLASLSLTAIIMNGFEHTLSRQIELAYFVPLLAGHGGNTGGQTVGTVLAGLSAGAITEKDAMKVIAKESLSGLSMGAMLGLGVGAVAYYVMGISSHVSTVIMLTIPPLSAIASTLASGLPFLCIFLGLDPTVIAAPAMTSFVDVTGLLCYFLIANQIFALWGLEL